MGSEILEEKTMKIINTGTPQDKINAEKEARKARAHVAAQRRADARLDVMHDTANERAVAARAQANSYFDY